ncbi:hypothetical protein LCGC14_2810560, partial [marine sediment metagenome]
MAKDNADYQIGLLNDVTRLEVENAQLREQLAEVRESEDALKQDAVDKDWRIHEPKEAQGRIEKGIVESMLLGTELGITRADLRIANERIAELEGHLVNMMGLWESEDMDSVVYLVVKDCLLWPVGLTKTYFDKEKDEIVDEVADPREFVIAPGYDDIWKTPWCGEKLRKPLSWVKMNYPDKYKEVKTDNEKKPDEHGEKSFMELENENVTV